MDKSVWKGTAIIAIALLIVETLLFSYLYIIGNREIERDTECSMICGNEEEAIIYYYDSYTKECTCLDREQEVIKTITMD